MDSRRLLEYWLDELNDSESSRLEEHLFECSHCTAELKTLVALGSAIREAHNGGHLAAVVPAAFVHKLKDAGMSVREYRLDPQASVYCTIAPQDDFVVGHLRAPLEGVTRLDAVLEELDSGSTQRLTDIPFNAAEGEVVMVPAASALRPVDKKTLRVHIVSIEPAGERTIGTYTFNHHATRA